jgi:hypothetical protein
MSQTAAVIVLPFAELVAVVKALPCPAPEALLNHYGWTGDLYARMTKAVASLDIMHAGTRMMYIIPQAEFLRFYKAHRAN